MLPFVHLLVPFYGVCASLGLLAAFGVFLFRSRSSGLGLLKNVQLAAVVAIGILVGSRILFVITMLPSIFADFSFDRLLNTVINGGFVFYGGLLGTIAAVFIYGRARKIDIDNLFKLVVPCFPLFHAFGRIGCFMSGCCYGIPFSFGFPMAFDPDTIRFPVQLAESACCLLIFAALLAVERKRPDVQLLYIYLISYGIIRFGLEFLRGDAVRGVWGPFSTSQWISLAVIAVCIIKIVKNKRSLKHEERI